MITLNKQYAHFWKLLPFLTGEQRFGRWTNHSGCENRLHILHKHQWHSVQY